MMSALEIVILVMAIGAAVFYLAHRAWRRFGGGREGCCGSCPVGSREKIRLAGRAEQGSTE